MKRGWEDTPTLNIAQGETSFKDAFVTTLTGFIIYFRAERDHYSSYKLSLASIQRLIISGAFTMWEKKPKSQYPGLPAYVLDKRGLPLRPTTRKRAHQLLTRGRARIHKYWPFTIRIIDLRAEDVHVEGLVLKLDPGSETTGMALVRIDVPKATSSEGASPEVPLDIDWILPQVVIALIHLKRGRRRIHLRMVSRSQHPKEPRVAKVETS